MCVRLSGQVWLGHASDVSVCAFVCVWSGVVGYAFASRFEAERARAQAAQEHKAEVRLAAAANQSIYQFELILYILN